MKIINIFRYFFIFALICGCSVTEKNVQTDLPTPKKEEDNNDPVYIKKFTKSWTAYKGRMNWNDAIKKCSKLKMRLPTIKEFHEACRLDLCEKWLNDTKDVEELYASSYWTSEEYGLEDVVYTVAIINSRSVPFDKSAIANTRCIK